MADKVFYILLLLLLKLTKSDPYALWKAKLPYCNREKKNNKWFFMHDISTEEKMQHQDTVLTVYISRMKNQEA